MSETTAQLVDDPELETEQQWFSISGRCGHRTPHLFPEDADTTLCKKLDVPRNQKGGVNMNRAYRFKGFANHAKPREKWCTCCRRRFKEQLYEGG